MKRKESLANDRFKPTLSNRQQTLLLFIPEPERFEGKSIEQWLSSFNKDGVLVQSILSLVPTVERWED
jgi:hypothetical protein